MCRMRVPTRRDADIRKKQFRYEPRHGRSWMLDQSGRTRILRYQYSGTALFLPDFRKSMSASFSRESNHYRHMELFSILEKNIRHSIENTARRCTIFLWQMAPAFCGTARLFRILPSGILFLRTIFGKRNWTLRVRMRKIIKTLSAIVWGIFCFPRSDVCCK